jgi:hypothetical protein
MKRGHCAAVVLLVAAIAAAGSTDKTIPMPQRDQSVKIGFASEGGKVDSVRIQHYPDEDTVTKARTKEPDDKQLTFWNFSVENRNASRKVRMTIEVEVIGTDGSVVGRGDKKDTVDAGKLDDNIRVWIRMRTLDVVSAKSARLRLSIEPK